MTLLRRAAAVLLLTLWALAPAGESAAQRAEDDMVQLDFQNAELTAVIDTIARLTGKNFIYDDRVRGRVTIVSPTPMPLGQAYAVFESVLQVKGFTTVESPGGALKVIPLREAKESSVDTRSSTRAPANRDAFITRLIPLSYIDAESIVNTLKPLVSKDAAIAAYQPTNTVIVTESASNIRRLIAILDAIDVETYREELAVIRLEYADAASLAEQLSEIFGAEVSSTSAPAPRTPRARRRAAQAAATPSNGSPGAFGSVRIITDDRTNALIVLAPRTQLEEVRRLVRLLDVPVTGGGRIHVYYLKHADAEELAQTLTTMITGAPQAPTPAGGAAAGGAGAQAIRSAVSGLSEGLTVTADPATNALVIQASQEGFRTIAAVIEQLDVSRPQVLVEALIMEVDVTDNEALGFNGLVKVMSGDTEFAIALASDAATAGALGAAPDMITDLVGDTGIPLIGSGQETLGEDTTIQGILRASASDAGTNILSAPHILTSDNEEAEIRIGDNIPIVTSRLDAATGVAEALSTSVNVERQDIGVTLRVTPQITEGEQLRLTIFQELTAVNEALSQTTAQFSDSAGVALSSRRVENTVVVADGETVVVGGLLSDVYDDSVTKVPFLGDIPVLGWAFKTSSRSLRKVNLLVFLTPHIIRARKDLERQTIRKREEFVDRSARGLRLSKQEMAEERREMARAREAGEPYEAGRGLNPVRHSLLDHADRYPLERMLEIEREQAERASQEATEDSRAPARYYLQAGVYGDEGRAVETLTELVDLGYDGALVSGERGGSILYEVRLGPYTSMEEAQSQVRILERSRGLAPTILIEPPEESPEP